MTLRILVVDDHEVVRLGLRSLLSNQPNFVVVDEAASGEEAIEKTLQHHPDVVVMDILMPEMNGIEACEIIKEHLPDIDVIMLTSDAKDELRFDAFNAGAADYVLKQGGGDELIHTIQRVHERRLKFTHITLENWRNFGHAQAVLQDRVFLIGPNASGKSNFLDVFRFLCALVTPGGGFEKAITNRGGISRIRNLAARSQSDIVIQVNLRNADGMTWSYRLAFAQNNQGRPELKAEQVWRDEVLLLERPNEADRRDSERLRQTYLEQTFANHEFRAIADFFATIHYNHPVPQLVREPERYTSPQSDPYGGDFVARIAGTPTRIRDARLRHIQKALQVAVPQLRELKLEKDEQGRPHLYGNYEHWRPKDVWQTEADFSDGTLRLMGLLWAILDGSGPLLLEEPELSLHPEIVRYIPQMIRNLQRASRRKYRQILISTHSSDLLREPGIAADEILLFVPTNEGSEIQVGVEIAEVRTLLEAGIPVAEVVLPRTQPVNARQLALLTEGV